MYKFILFLLITLFFTSGAFAQLDSEDPDESGMAMPNIVIMEAAPIVDVVEGVGTVSVASIAFRDKPEADSRVKRYSVKDEKVLILGESGDWFKVRMFNNAEAYINKQYVRTERVFKDESTTINSMDKKVSFEINDLLERFNGSLKSSPFAKKYQIVPSLAILDARKNAGRITMVFVYSCVDLEGNMLPSYKSNALNKEMRHLLELIFTKLLLTQNSAYEIIIKIPTFDSEGKVSDISKNYATLEINGKNVNMEDIKSNGSKLWGYVKSSVKIDELFLSFPPF